jgi:anti-anti-sigma factor
VIGPSLIGCFRHDTEEVGSEVTTTEPGARAQAGGSEIATVRTAGDPTGSQDDVELSVFHGSTHTLVRLRGEIDIATAPGLRERLFGLLRRGSGLVILDLSGVPFCDASGLGTLVGSHRHATMLGVTLRLTALRPRVARLVYINGMDRVLSVYPAPLTWHGPRGRRSQPRLRACR